MNNKHFFTVCILFHIIFMVFSGNIYAYNDISLQLKVLNLTEAGPPEIFNDYLIFTYEVEEPTRYIGIRFEHEDYKELHIYSKNGNDIYFLVYLIPEGCDTLKYRMVIDGLWITDKFNSRQTMDPLTGIVFSIVQLEQVKAKTIINPVFENNSSVSFSYRGESGKNIYIIGDFNNWDPYMYRLEELEPGYYFVNLDIGPGKHYYMFLINGETVADPNNENMVYDREGKLLSIFYVE